MIAIPLPFVLALLLLLLMGLVRAGGTGSTRFLFFLGLCFAMLVLVGLRWTFDIAIFRFLQPVVAALVPPAAWICFAPLREGRSAPLWLHLLPAALALCFSVLWPWVHLPVDALLAALFSGYGLALLRLGLRGADELPHARLSSASSIGQAGVVAGGLLILSGLVDAVIAMDFGLSDGRHAESMISAGHLMLLPLIGIIMMRLAVSRPVNDTQESEESAPVLDTSIHDVQVLERITALMAERHLYRDPDLTLERLARRLVIPSRQVSGAINRVLGCNVSQAINEWRIREAMQLLDDTDAPVTQIMFDCGFQTKSNFNREFRRISGTSPSAWRSRARKVLT